MLVLVEKLIRNLEDTGVRYCHWKSNYRLDSFLDGEGDLDLLVHREDAYKFEEILHKLNFKEALGRDAGIKHFYGLDSKTGKLVHVHVYYQLKTGTDFLKPYRLPIEDFLLNCTIRHESGIRILRKEIELIIFVIRLALKFSSPSYFAIALREIKEIRKELSFLVKDIDKSLVEEEMEGIFPLVEKNSVLRLIDSIETVNLLEIFLLSRRIAISLSCFRYISKSKEEFFNVFFLSKKFLQKLGILRNKKKKLANGGVLIAVTGLDATGKTSITRDMSVWLSNHFTVSLFHFGKPSSTFETFPFRMVMKVLRSGRKKNYSKPIKQDSEISLAYALRYMILAYERYSLMRKVWKVVNEGGIVILDRYKSENAGMMDSKRLSPQKLRGVKKVLALMENRFYEKMPIPDLIINLTVPLEVAIERNRKRKERDNEEFLKERYLLNKDLKFKAKTLKTIDTSLFDYSTILKKIKIFVWSVI